MTDFPGLVQVWQTPGGYQCIADTPGFCGGQWTSHGRDHTAERLAEILLELGFTPEQVRGAFERCDAGS